jgi:antitoxin component of MazEF toxin-antitoxin module
MGKIDGDHLTVTIPPKMAEKLKILPDSIVSVDNQNGKFNLTHDTENA